MPSHVAEAIRQCVIVRGGGKQKTKNYEENDTKPNIHCHNLIYIYLHACERVPWVRDGKCVRECVRKVREEEEEEEVRSLLLLLLVLLRR